MAAKTPPKGGKTTTTALARRDDTKKPGDSSAVATLGLSDEEMMRDARGGMETMSREDLAIPRLGILQGLSPQMDPRDPAYIEGAKIGQIFENINRKVWDGEKGILLVLVQFNKTDVEWKPKRGGFVKAHPATANIFATTTRDEKTGDNVLPNGNNIVPTVEYYAFLVDEEEETYEQCLLSMAKTDMKEARRLATVVSTFQIQLENKAWITPALFFRAFRFTTVPKKNDKGSWFGWKFEPGPNTVDLFPETGEGRVLYQAAVAFRNAVAAGKVRVSDPSAGHDGGGAPPDDKAPM